MGKDINSFFLLQKISFFSFHLSEDSVHSNNIRQTPVGLCRLCKAVKNDNTKDKTTNVYELFLESTEMFAWEACESWDIEILKKVNTKMKV